MKKNINTNSVGAEFRKVLPHKNFLTPTVIQYTYAGNYIVELATGEAMDGSEQFGVTVVDSIAKEHRHDLSRLFPTRIAARKHINQLAQL